MVYLDTSKLSARLGSSMYARLTDRVNGTTADNTVGEQIIDEAEAEGHSYLAMRYATPIDLSDHPELSKVFEARMLDLAEYVAWKGSPFVSAPPPRVAALYATALKWFAAVAAGDLTLPAAEPPAAQTAEDDGPRYSSRERTFTSEELDGL